MCKFIIVIIFPFIPAILFCQNEEKSIDFYSNTEFGFYHGIGNITNGITIIENKEIIFQLSSVNGIKFQTYILMLFLGLPLTGFITFEF